MQDFDAQVIVIGAGIAGLACAHRLHTRGSDVLALESGDRVGGRITTLNEGGYQFEAGPNTLVANKPAMRDLIHEAGLDGEIIEGAPAAKRRWISLNGRLCPVPTGLGAAICSPLLGPTTIARALGDLVIRRPTNVPPDESVESFVTRRFGRRVFTNLVRPFLTGIYAGNPARLEARSILPALVQAEAEWSSVVRGVLANRRRARRSDEPRLPMNSITLRDGLLSLPQRMARLLGDRLRLNTHVARLEEDAGRIDVIVDDARRLRCAQVVVAGGAASTATLRHLPGGEDLMVRLASIPHAGVATVGLSFDRTDIPHSLDGFGYLHGPGSDGPVLGCLFRSSVFPHTAPAGKALLVSFIGGTRFPGCARMRASALIDLARADLAGTLGIRAAPLKSFAHGWSDAVPQYERGHARLLASVQTWSAVRRVSVIGSLLTGVSLNDCVTAARAEADRLIAQGVARTGGRENQPCASV